MTALAADRNTLEKDGYRRSFPVAASTLIYAGALVMVNSSGVATKGATATGLTAVGCALARADNSAGSAGAMNVKVRRGIFNFLNSSGGDAITEANVGTVVYAVDDQTVALTSGSSTRSTVGRVYEVDADGVWVEIL